MPKRMNTLPNERLDIDDFEQQTTGLSRGGQKQELQDFILNNMPAVIAGFRVAIANQVTSARLLTIHNGVAFDRSGQLVTNEDDLDAQRSITLPNSAATYSLEVVFVESASDTDARGFWDPSFDNGSDPSGDQRPKGREFVEPVATRLTPDWQIVSPVSTTGFEVDSNPNSTKIPVANVTVFGGVITGIAAAARTDVLRAVVGPGIAQLKLLDTRDMPDTGSVQLDPANSGETLAITSNDRANNILNVSTPPVSTYAAGTRVIIVGVSPSLFIPYGDASDKRPRFFQADSDAGYYIGLDPTQTGDARSDVNITSLKREVDWLSAQLRELKFGAARSTAIGNNSPPVGDANPALATSFARANRYYDPAGGVLPSRLPTVTVGTGRESWGDFNSQQLGSDDAALTAAVNFIVSRGGGSLLVKKGNYTLTAPLPFLAANCVIMGEGAGNTTINSPTTVFIGDSDYTFDSIAISLTTVHTDSSVIQSQSASLCFRNCIIDGVTGNVFSGCAINTQFNGRVNGWNASVELYKFISCKFASRSTSATDAACHITGGNSFSFSACTFTTQAPLLYACILENCTNFTADSCGFFGEVTLGSLQLTGSSNGTFLNSEMQVGDNQIELSDCTDVEFDKLFSAGLSVAPGTNQTFVNATDCTRVSFVNCAITQSGNNDSHTQLAMSFVSPVDCVVRGCLFTNFDEGIRLGACSGCVIEHNTFDGTGNGRTAITFVGNTSAINVENSVFTHNKFINYKGDRGLIAGFDIVNETDTVAIIDCVFSDNIFSGMGKLGGASSDVFGFRFLDASTVRDTIIARNIFELITAPNIVLPVSVRNGNDIQIIDNNFAFIAFNGGTQTYYGAIRTEDCDGVVISNNVIDNVGVSGTAALNRGAILVTRSPTNTTVNHNSLTITGNIIRTVKNSTGAAIMVTDVGKFTCINNNSIALAPDTFTGIAIFDFDTGTDTPEVTDVTINGNTIDCGGSATSTGIWTQWNRNITYGGGRVAITGNVISNYTVRGIFVSGLGVTFRVPACTISGNSCFASGAAIGIWAFAAIACSITGNAVVLSGTGVQNGILITNCLRFALSGNSVWIASDTVGANCIDVSQSQSFSGAVTGNMCSFGSTTNSLSSDGIVLPTVDANIYCVGNVCASNVPVGTSSPAGVAIRKLGSAAATEWTRAYSLTESTSAGAPSTPATGSLGALAADIGLNIRKI